MDTLADQYYVKAMDSYPFSLEKAVENLNFALSYDNEHVGANYLMAKLYMELIFDFEQAESYFKRAMGSDPHNQNVCLDYALLLTNMKEFEKAERLIDFVLGFKDADLARVYHLVGVQYEYQHHYEKAIMYYEDALLEAYNEEITNALEGEIKRVKAKQKLRKKPSQNKKKSK
jgi:tetratricopeptide (TPR) repeat protein